MKISVILINLNNLEVLKQSLPILLSQETPKGTAYEVIIVDSGSSDGSRQYIRSLTSSLLIKYFNHGKTLSPSRARNIGVKMAKGEILAFLDSDCLPKRDWLKKVLASFEENEQVEAIFFSRYPDEGPSLGTFYRRYYTLIYSRKFRAMDKVIMSDELLKQRTPFYMLAACNFAIKKEVFEKVGKMRTKFSDPAGEDVMLEIDLLRNGHKILFDPSNTVRHLHDIGLMNLLRKAWRQGKAIFLIRKYSKKYFLPKHALELRSFLANAIFAIALLGLIFILPAIILTKVIVSAILMLTFVSRRIVDLKMRLNLVIEIKNHKSLWHYHDTTFMQILLFDVIDFFVKISKIAGYIYTAFGGK